MLVLNYALGALLQIVGTFGLIFIFSKISSSPYHSTKKKVLFFFALSYIVEATFLGLLSFVYLTSKPFLIFYFWIKVILGMVYLKQHFKTIITFLSENLWLTISIFALVFTCSVPTANFDCFSAHFSIPKLFIEATGYPIRPDYEYLDALPLSGHMWYLPGMAANFEGSLNIVSAIFSIAIILMLYVFHGKKIAFIGFILLFGMPQWIRVTLDPMMDTPSCFYALFSFYLAQQYLRDPKKMMGPFFMASCFLISLKPTLFAFPVLATVLILSTFKKEVLTKSTLLWVTFAFIAGGLWYFKNLVLHQNALYPHLFAGTSAPYIPPDLIPEKVSFLTSLLQYLKVIFIDHRYVLSYGPWPLIGLPLLFIFIKNKTVRLLLLYLCFGFLITWFFTSFKNRYYMPYLILAIPSLSFAIAKAGPWTQRLLKLNTALTLLLFLPYFLQPAYAIFKNFNYESYYSFKYPKYEIFQRVNQSNPGKVLLVGQPSYWLKGSHQLSVVSETHLDFSRITELNELLDHIRQADIKTIVYDKTDAEGMAQKSDRYYSKKAYLASRCSYWMDLLFNSPHVTMTMDERGVLVGQLN